MDEYVFGDVKDIDTNLIPSLQAAVRLRKMLSLGGRRFEIIYCRDDEQSKLGSELESWGTEYLGYDVAAVSSDCWSIVYDFAQSEWPESFDQQLNPNGLFAHRTDAENYLRGYRMHDEPDADMPFDVVEVVRIRSSK